MEKVIAVDLKLNGGEGNSSPNLDRYMKKQNEYLKKISTIMEKSHKREEEYNKKNILEKAKSSIFGAAGVGGIGKFLSGTTAAIVGVIAGGVAKANASLNAYDREASMKNTWEVFNDSFRLLKSARESAQELFSSKDKFNFTPEEMKYQQTQIEADKVSIQEIQTNTSALKETTNALLKIAQEGIPFTPTTPTQTNNTSSSSYSNDGTYRNQNWQRMSGDLNYIADKNIQASGVVYSAQVDKENARAAANLLRKTGGIQASWVTG